MRGTGFITARLFAMHRALDPETFDDLDEETEPGDADMVEQDVSEMVRRLAAALDDAINPAADARMVVAEALMRLSAGLYAFAAGPEATRQRFLGMALRTSAGATLH